MADSKGQETGTGTGYRWIGFRNWAEVQAYVLTYGIAWYLAPMDRAPVACRAETKGRRIRMFPPRSSDADPFWADAGHLDRFRQAAEGEPAPVPRCPECGDRLTDRTVIDGQPAYCDTCDREVAEELG